MCVSVCDIISNGLKLDGSNELVSDGVGGTGVHGEPSLFSCQW